MKNELTLDNKMFDIFRGDFEEILNSTIGNMEEKQTAEATINLKLTVMLQHADTLDGKNVTIPKFLYNIGSVMQVKDRKAGRIEEQYALEFDNDKDKYVVEKYDDGQYQFDDNLNVLDGKGDSVENENESTEILQEINDNVSNVQNEGMVKDVEGTTEQERRFNWLKKFIGKSLLVEKNNINGSYQAHSKEGQLVLSTAVSPSHVNYCEGLGIYDGKEVRVEGYGQDMDNLYCIDVEYEEEAILSVKNPGA